MTTMGELRKWNSMHPTTRRLVRDVVKWHEQNGGKGCCLPRPDGETWFLCSYHEGYDDALGEANQHGETVSVADFDRLQGEVESLTGMVSALQERFKKSLKKQREVEAENERLTLALEEGDR
jgi:hypothetical protein